MGAVALFNNCILKAFTSIMSKVFAWIVIFALFKYRFLNLLSLVANSPSVFVLGVGPKFIIFEPDTRIGLNERAVVH